MLSGTEIELHLPALLPEDYVSDIHLRLVLYKRIASAATPAALDDLQAEMIDRFGPLPPPARSVYRVAALKIRARELGIRKVDAGPLGGYVLFDDANTVDPQAVIRLVQRNPRAYRLDGPLKLRFTWRADSEADRFRLVENLIDTLASRQHVDGSDSAARSA
jgi:transcription-repair coupling factor (superfamily II helicase)